MQHFSDTFSLAADAQTMAAGLIRTCEEFAHILEAAPLIPCLVSQRALVHHGARANGLIVQPRWQSALGMFGEWALAEFCRPLTEGRDPDFVVFLDAAAWSGPLEARERLLFHELSHIVAVEDEFGVVKRRRDDGRPLLKLVPHDYELFRAEIERYGVQACGADTLPHAIVEGEARLRRRGLRIA